MQTVKYVHWQEGDTWLGYLQDYPDYWTQGETLDDLIDHPPRPLPRLVGRSDPRSTQSGGAVPFMKRVDLIRAIEELGCELVRHGAKHHWYRNALTGVSQAVPRHREIKELLAKRILRMLSNTEDGGSDESADT